MMKTSAHRIWWIPLLTLGASLPVSAGLGDGINLGKAVITPEIQLGFTYDSNVRLQSEELATLNPSKELIASPALEVRPSIFANIQQEDLRAQLSYEHVMRMYLAEEAQESGTLTDFTAKAEAEVMPERQLGFRFREMLANRRYVTPYDSQTDETSLVSSDTFGRRYNSLLAEGRYTPGSALEFTLGLDWFHDRQDVYSGSDASLDAPYKNELGAKLKASWKFFPRTMLMLETNYTRGAWNSLPECSTAIGTSSIQMCKGSTTNEWYALTGVAGQFTESIRANLFLGYGGLSYPDSERVVAGSLDQISGLAGLRGQAFIIFSPLETQSFSGGFTRQFGDSVNLDYVISNAFFVSYSGMFAGRVSASATLSFELRQHDSADLSEYNSRMDKVFSGSVGVDYRIRKWLIATASIRPLTVGASPTASSAASGPDSTSIEEYLDRSFEHTQYIYALSLRGTY